MIFGIKKPAAEKPKKKPDKKEPRSSQSKKKSQEQAETAWFKRDEHSVIRDCTCFCGHVFKSKARLLLCSELRQVKDRDGGVVLDKNGTVKTKNVDVTRCLSLEHCPKCQSEHNWIQSFE